MSRNHSGALQFELRIALGFLGGPGIANIKKEQLTESELFEALREHGVYKLEDVGLAVMENDGKISVIKRQDMH